MVTIHNGGAWVWCNKHQENHHFDSKRGEECLGIDPNMRFVHDTWSEQREPKIHASKDGFKALCGVEVERPIFHSLAEGLKFRGKKYLLLHQLGAYNKPRDEDRHCQRCYWSKEYKAWKEEL